MSQPLLFEPLKGLQPFSLGSRAPAPSREAFHKAFGDASTRSKPPTPRPDPKLRTELPSRRRDEPAPDAERPGAAADKAASDPARPERDALAHNAPPQAQAGSTAQASEPTDAQAFGDQATAEPAPRKPDTSAQDAAANALLAQAQAAMLAVLLPDASAATPLVQPLPAQNNLQATSVQELAGQAQLTEALQAVTKASTPPADVMARTQQAQALTTVPVVEANAKAIPSAPPPQAPEAEVKTDAKAEAAPLLTQQAIETMDRKESSDASTQDQPQQPPPREQAPKPTKPASPVAAMHVAQSLESLRHSNRLTAHKADAALPPLVAAAQQATPNTPAPASASATSPPPLEAAPALEATPASAEGPKTESTAETVKPWEISQPVARFDPAAPQAQRLEGDRPVGQPAALRETLHATLVQATREGARNELRLQLSPEHLGRMEIRVISHEGALSAQIRVDHAQARDLMQTQLAELRQTLADQGIKIDKLEVNVGQDRQPGQGFDLAGGMQQRMGQHQQPQPQTPFQLSQATPYFQQEVDPITEEAGPEAILSPLPSAATLDTRV